MIRAIERFDDFVNSMSRSAAFWLMRAIELLFVVFVFVTTVLSVVACGGEGEGQQGQQGGRRVEFLGDRVEKKEARPTETRPAESKPEQSKPAELPQESAEELEGASAPPVPVAPPTPAPGPRTEQGDFAGFIEHRPDIRPVITAYVRPNCPPCSAFKTWEAANRDTFPLRFEIQQAPENLATPSFRWKDGAGKLWKPREDGWKGPETANAILRDYRATVPGLKFDPEAAERTGRGTGSGSSGPGSGGPGSGGVGGSEDIIALARRFAGTKGKLVFAPEKPVVADVKGDGTVVLEFAELNATYDLTGDNPTITFEQPVPGGTYTAWGWGVGFKLNHIAYAPPPVGVLKVGTNWKELQFKFSIGGE